VPKRDRTKLPDNLGYIEWPNDGETFVYILHAPGRDEYSLAYQTACRYAQFLTDRRLRPEEIEHMFDVQHPERS